MQDEPDRSAEMTEFVRARIMSFAAEIGIDPTEWLHDSGLMVITDEMVDTWIDENPDMQARLRSFGLG